MNIPLLRKIQNHIKNEPNRFIMLDYFNVIGNNSKAFKNQGFLNKLKGENPTTNIIDNCTTACCIAGWACAIQHEEKDILVKNIGIIAGGLLGITKEQSEELFCEEEWEHFWPEYNKIMNDLSQNYDGMIPSFDSLSPEKRAELGVMAIDKFISFYAQDNSIPS